MPYTTADKVISFTQITAADLKKTAEQFDSLLSTLVNWVTAAMNAYMGKSYTEAELAADTDMANAFESVATQAVDNHLCLMVQKMQSPVITVNDFVVQFPKMIILTDEMKQVLDRYKQGVLVAPVFTEGTYRIHSGVTGLVAENNTDEVD